MAGIRRHRAWYLLAAALVAGCGSKASSPFAGAQATGPVQLEVESSHYNDTRIYALLDGTWIRLGLVTGLTKDRFTVPSQALAVAGGFRILVDPLGSSAAYLTEPIHASPGDALVLQIAAQLHMSTWWRR